MLPLGKPPGGRPRFRRREDYAVELLDDARAHLEDIPRVSRALRELGRFYNPVVDAPIVDPPTRRAVLEHLEAGRAAEASRLLERCLAAYSGAERHPPPGSPSDAESSSREEPA
jgi:hypothetical protein